MQRSLDRERPRRVTRTSQRTGRSGTRHGTAVRMVFGAAAAGTLTWTLGHRAVGLAWRGASAGDVVAAWTAPGVRVEDVVELVAVLFGAGLAAWFCLTLVLAAACTAARSAGLAWLAGERLVVRVAPGVVRRALVVSAGTGVALAGATLPAVGLAPPPPDDLGWAVTVEGSTSAPTAQPVSAPTATATTTSPDTAGATAPHAPATATDDRTVTVEPGDTLWDIARAHLPAGATTADVAAAWPSWYAANSGVVGPDPDLIHPGQRLVAPTALDGAADGADR